jgi:hypothetical protein
MFAQNAGNRISEVLDFKIFRGGMPPDPPTGAELLGIPHSKPWIRPWLPTPTKPKTTFKCVNRLRDPNEDRRIINEQAEQLTSSRNKISKL